MAINLRGGHETVNISPAAHNLSNIHANKDTDNVVTIHGNPTGIDTLNVEDGNHNDLSPFLNGTYTLTSSSLGSTVGRTGSGSIRYDHITFVNLNGGTGPHIYDINGTGATFGTTITTNNSLTGVDTVNVRATSSLLNILNTGGAGTARV